MAACSPWTYTGISSQVFRALQSLGRKQGFAVPNSPSGGFTIHKAGLKINFKYAWNKSSRSLELVCVSKPQSVSCSMIKGIADQIIAQCGGKPT